MEVAAMIIDIHMHLGDFLYPNGKFQIYSSSSLPNPFNIQRFEEDILLFRGNTLTKRFFEKYDDAYTISVKNRIHEASLKNLQQHKRKLKRLCQKLFADADVFFACMPIAPGVTFNDVLEASYSDSTIIPFTTINPDASVSEQCKQIETDMETAYGLKLHPIIQGVPFDSEITLSVLEVVQSSGKPVLFHAGASRYYVGDEAKYQHCDYDSIAAAKKMIDSFPNIKFIMGHAGIAEYKDWASEFSKYENVFCDGTVQSAPSLRWILNAYGEDRIMYASDFPCVRTEPTIKAYLKAFSPRIREKVFFRNALEVLQITDLELRSRL